MDVLLLQDVDNLGLAGDVAKVKPGFARNFLIPQRLAILATGGALKQADSIRKAGEIQRARDKADAEATINQIKDQVLIFERRAGDRGQLYGSVTAIDIATALSEQSGVEIDRRKIRLSEPIRALGDYNVTIRLMVEVSTTIHVAVIAEGDAFVPLSEREQPDESDAEEASTDVEAEATPEPQAAAEVAEAAE